MANQVFLNLFLPDSSSVVLTLDSSTRGVVLEGGGVGFLSRLPGSLPVVGCDVGTPSLFLFSPLFERVTGIYSKVSMYVRY